MSEAARSIPRRRAAWDARLEEVRGFIRAHRRLPQQRTTDSAELILGRWVSAQRKRRLELAEDQRTLLDEALSEVPRGSIGARAKSHYQKWHRAFTEQRRVLLDREVIGRLLVDAHDAEDVRAILHSHVGALQCEAIEWTYRSGVVVGQGQRRQVLPAVEDVLAGNARARDAPEMTAAQWARVSELFTPPGPSKT